MSSPVFNAFAPGNCALTEAPIRGERTVQSDEGPVRVNGDDVFYLASVSGADGRPSPTGQLETVRKTTGEREITVTETVGTGLVKRGREWTLRTIVARRTYTHDKYAKREIRQQVQAAARWLKLDGSVANIWCRLVLVASARAAGFAIPKCHLGTARQQGNRAVGVEDHSISPAQLALTARAERGAVENAPGPGTLPPMSDVL